ncbi:MAG: Cof-type HAD-IIB family hydrolase [Firmicutes bacterium]|nr:Cof-type HAD-IIB family hydrolase [Bacillota bacterium]
MIKLVAVDLDGTLLNSQGKISIKTIETIQLLKKHHVYIVIASGRTYHEITKIIQPLDLFEYDRAYFIAYNGVLTLKVFPFEIIDKKLMDKEDVKKISSLVLPANLKMHVFCEHFVYISNDIKLLLLDNTAYEKTVVKIDMNLYDENEAVYKVLLYDEEKILNTFKGTIENSWYDQYNIFKSSNQLLEFVHLKGSKGDALKKLLVLLKLDKSETMAFGDEENDISLLKASGISVAMGNAKPFVKEIADVITLSNDLDGISEIMNQYINQLGDDFNGI